MEQSATHLVGSLEKLGVKFKSFRLSHRGRYSARDADWNYKDVPHFAVVHKLADACLASVTEEHSASVNLQKILGFRFPLALFNYHPSSGAQTYFTTLFFYVLVIETKSVEISANETEVVTTYNIGATGLWMVFFPVIKWSLKRNYRDLMSTDIPMRERRGQLRDWGYEFKYDKEPCGFEGTINISKTNTWPGPSVKPDVLSYTSPVSDLQNGKDVFLGRSDHYGVRLKLTEGQVTVFPRLCPHEGANLDESVCDGKVVRCPWHLRAFRPLAKLEVTEGSRAELPHGVIAVSGEKIVYSVQSG